MKSDEQLLQAWVEGDQASGQALIERHYDGIVRFFKTKACPSWQDLVQRTFLVCAEKREAYRGESSFRAFLFGIARHVLLEQIRDRVRAGKMPDITITAIVDLSPGVGTIAFKRADQRLLVTALQRIPLELQTAIELFYWEELAVDEIAHVLDVPAGTVKSRLHRGRAMLAEVLPKISSAEQEQATVQRVLDDWAQGVRRLSERPTSADT